MSDRLAEIADAAYALRNKLRDLSAEEREIRAKLEELENEIVQHLDEMNLTNVRTRNVSASITESVVANVENWDAVYDFIKQNDAFYLLQRRVSNAAYKEMLDQGNALPGAVPYTKRGVNLRKVS